MDDAPYHEGEQALQARFGLRDKMDGIGRRVIRDFMPEEHRQFFAQLPWLLVGSRDITGRPWASVLTGDPGFVTSPDPRTLRVTSRPMHGDPLSTNLRHGAPIGLLGIEPHTRRRNRMNGTVSRVRTGEFEIGVGQSFGNCPKHINRKIFERRKGRGTVAEPEVDNHLTPHARAIIAAADMFFIASAFVPPADPGRHHGVDVSHRGGKPGFVRVEADGSLTIPDYAGNFAFNTLGNIEKDRRAGLLFIDFESGDVLQLAADASIDWDDPEIHAVAGVERLLRVRPAEVRSLPAAFPLRASAIGDSPKPVKVSSRSHADLSAR